MSHPGLVVSEGSALFSSVCAAGLTGERRARCFDGCLCASHVAGGRAADTLHISKARSEEEMKIDAEKMAQKPVARSIHILSFTHTVRDTLVRVSIYTYAWACLCLLCVCVCVLGWGWWWWWGVPLLLEPCDIIAFDLQINRESVHLLGGDGRCDGRAH